MAKKIEEPKAGERMLKARREKQQQMDLVILEQLAPEDHLLRKIDKSENFSFIHDLCEPLYRIPPASTR